VDIFPLDGVPTGKVGNFVWKKKLTALRGLRNLSCFDELVNVNRSFPGVKGLIFKLGMDTNIQKYINTNKTLKSIDKYLAGYPLSKNNLIGNPMGGWWFKEIYPKNYYEKNVFLPFEDINISCPKEYKKILTQMYGDYMTPPPEEDRNQHGTSLVK
jgi:lipopolysaccharide cholinephosphotransferase